MLQHRKEMRGLSEERQRSHKARAVSRLCPVAVGPDVVETASHAVRTIVGELMQRKAW